MYRSAVSGKPHTGAQPWRGPDGYARGNVEGDPSGPTRPLKSAGVDDEQLATRWPAGVRREFCPEPKAVARSRWFADELCGRWRVDDRTRQVTGLVVTELATNAIVHAQTRFVVALRLTPAYLHIAVRDRDPQPARIWDSPNPQGRGGRGLILVQTLCVAWGTNATPGGKVTWAAVGRRGSAR